MDKKKYPKITIAGDLGSGKSTVGKIIAEKEDFEFYSTGYIQRQIAEKHNMTTLELNKYSETHPEIDDEIDSAIVELRNEKKKIIMDSRMAWHFMPKSFKVYLIVNPVVAAERIVSDAQRDKEKYKNLEEAKEKIIHRKASENKRYTQLYKVDCSDLNNYDLVVDSTLADLNEVEHSIMSSFRLWQEGKNFPNFLISPINLLPTKSIKEPETLNTESHSTEMTIARKGNFFYIIRGHLATSEAIKTGVKLVWGDLTDFDDASLPSGNEFRNIVQEWENYNGISFLELPFEN